MILNIAGVLLQVNCKTNTVCEYLNRKYNKFKTQYDDIVDGKVIINLSVSNEKVVGIEGIKLSIDKYKNNPVINIYMDNTILGSGIVDLKNKICDFRLKKYNEEIIDLTLSVIWRFIMHKYNLVLLHASAIVKDGKAILFCGHSGYGKSTILNLLETEGLTDEMSCISIDSNNKCVYASIPWRGTNKIYNQIEVKKIYILCKSNILKTEDINPLITHALLQKFIYFNLWYEGGYEKTLSLLKKIVKNVEISKLHFALENSKEEIYSII